MRICITRSEKYAYSETFIRDQIKGFSGFSKVSPIHSGRFPERDENDALLSPKLFWIIHKIIKTFVGRNNYFSNYGVKKYLKNNKIDVVLANYGISAAHLMPVCKSLNIPLLVIFHGHDATNKKTLKKYRNKYLYLFKYASYVIVVSEDMKKRLINIGAIPEKTVVIPCGVDITKFLITQNKKTNKNFLAVGRFTQKKGPLLTIKAFYKVLKKYPDARLTMVGKPNGLYQDCVNLVKELKIDQAVTFPGVLSQIEIAKLMAQSYAFVQHSMIAPNGDMEGTPVSIMEACASGLPVVSTFHGGIKNAIIHEKTGFLVAEGDYEKMAEYMIYLCENPDKASEIGLQGAKHITEHYNQEIQLQKLFNLAKQSIKQSNF